MGPKGQQGSSFAVEPLEPRQLLTAAIGASAVAYDAAGVLHMAFYDATTSNLKYATRGLDGRWSRTTTIDAAPGTGQQLSLALDAHGLPAIAYYDAANADLKFARSDGRRWSTATLDAKGKVGRNPSLAFAPGDYPLVSYYAATTLDLRLASFSGRRWSVTAIDESGSVGQFSSLAISPADGTWAIAYESQADHSIKFAQRRRSSFTLTTLDTLAPAANWSSKPALAFDPLGRPAVAYADPAADAILLTSAGRRSWNTATAASSANVANDTALTFDPNTGRPQIVYADRSGTINLASASGNSWTQAALGQGSAGSVAVNPVTHTFALAGTGLASQVDPTLAAPTGLRAAMAPAGVQLTWSDPASTETGFAIERSTDGVHFAALATVAANVTTYLDPTVSELTGYTYRVRAVTATSTGLTSDPASLTTGYLGAANLLAMATSPSHVFLSWTNCSVNAIHYEVYPSTDGEDFPYPYTIDPQVGTNMWSLGHLDPGTTYWFRVRAVAADGHSEDAQVSVTTPAATPLAKPDDFSAGISLDDPNWISLWWADNSTAETGYRVERSTDGAHYTTIDTLPADSTAYDDVTAAKDHTYWYRVVPFNNTGDGPASAIQSVAMSPAAPTNLQAVATSAGQIDLTWTNHSTLADHIEIWCNDGLHNFALVTDLAPTTTGYSVTTLPGGLPLDPTVSYAFWIAAAHGGAYGQTNAVAASTSFNAPGNVFADAGTPNALHVTWGDVLGETGYELESSTDGVHFTPLATLGADQTEYDATGLLPATRYYFRVRATGSGGDTPFSTPANNDTIA